MIIPLNAGSAFQRFSVSLGGRRLSFSLRWLTRFGFYVVDISEAGEPVVFGRSLHPGQDLLAGVVTDIGKIYLTGEPATVANLGKTNKLVFEQP